MQRVILGLVLAVSVAACGDSSSPSEPTPPQTINLTGNWSGNVAVAGATAQMVWTLSHSSDTDVSGPIRIGLPTGTVLLNGFLTGTLNGNVLTYTISVGPGGIPLSPNCVGQLGGTTTATLGTISTLAGDFTVRSSTCPAPVSNGTITLTKQ
jgi:hypothetical protein